MTMDLVLARIAEKRPFLRLAEKCCKCHFKLDQVNSENLLFNLLSMDIAAMDIMINDSTGSLQGSSGWYLMILGRYGAILFVTWWYWVSITWY